MQSEKLSAEAIEDYDHDLGAHYVKRYLPFYDILFVDREGYVFASVKEESDLHTNLIKGASGNLLGRKLRMSKEAYFVDFIYYAPSDETASFFIYPVWREGENFLGWIVFQAAINGINSIVTDKTWFGATGEVYIVNRKRVMLSQSRFIKDDSIMKVRVDTGAIKGALEVGQGEKITKDYRGVEVLSSFETFSVVNNSWIIVVEIDKSEVLTNILRHDSGTWEKELLGQSYLGLFTPEYRQRPEKLGVRVDVNEFARVGNNEDIFTRSLYTCTGIAIAFPKRFTYLIHLTPTDSVYLDGPLDDVFIRGRKTDFTGEVIRKIKFFEVTPSEFLRLQVYVVATHKESIRGVVAKLLEMGFQLNQINFLHNPKADTATMNVSRGSQSLKVTWFKDNQPTSLSRPQSSNNLAYRFEEILM
jgi:hypothetical protein